MALNGNVNKKTALCPRRGMALPVVAANPLMSRDVRRKASDGPVAAFSNSKPRMDKMRLPRKYAPTGRTFLTSVLTWQSSYIPNW